MKKGIVCRVCFMLATAVFLWSFIVTTDAQSADFLWNQWLTGTYSWSDCSNWIVSGHGDACTYTQTLPGNTGEDYVTLWRQWTGTGENVRVLSSANVNLVSLEMDWIIHYTNPSTITLEWGGGSLTANTEIIGDEGGAVFDHKGGTNTVGNLYIGYRYDEGDYPSIGHYKLSQSGVLTVNNNEYISYQGIGTFTQTAGSHTVLGDLTLGRYYYEFAEDFGTSIGTFELSGGSLDVGGDEYIGFAGDAVFNQTGGTHTIAGNVYCDPEGTRTPNTVTFNQQGGSLTVWEVIVRQDCVDTFGGGTRTILGENTLIIDGGVFNWQGGELIVDTIENGPEGTFNVSGASGEERNVNRLILAPFSTLNVSGVTLYYNELELYEGATINTSGGGSVVPASGANNPPEADAGGPYTGTVGIPVQFDGSGSIDPDGDIVLYEWDFDSDGVFDFSSATSPTATHTYPSAGTYTVTLRVIDDGGETDTATTTASIGVANIPPIADANGPYVADEGDTVTLDASGSYDPDDGDEIVSYEWDLDNDGEYDDATGITFSKLYEDDGVYTVGLRVTDTNGESSTATAKVTINNVAPSVGPISIDPEALVEVDTFITASADFTDPGTLDTHTAVWNWGDGTSESGTVIQGAGFGSVSDGHAYDTAGVYTVELQVTDDNGGQGTSVFQYIVVYDPAGGFVTGGGWIDSPEGAYKPDPSLIGKATFGFVSKYKKGATTPTGNTEFQLRAGDLNFHSSSYEWLVVTGNDYAKFKGSGTINGMGDHKFKIWAGDGEPDTFRIKIWGEDEFGIETVIYDNGMEPAIGGGSIVVHKAKKHWNRNRNLRQRHGTSDRRRVYCVHKAKKH